MQEKSRATEALEPFSSLIKYKQEPYNKEFTFIAQDQDLATQWAFIYDTVHPLTGASNDYFMLYYNRLILEPHSIMMSNHNKLYTQTLQSFYKREFPSYEDFQKEFLTALYRNIISTGSEALKEASQGEKEIIEKMMEGVRNITPPSAVNSTNFPASQVTQLLKSQNSKMQCFAKSLLQYEWNRMHFIVILKKLEHYATITYSTDKYNILKNHALQEKCLYLLSNNMMTREQFYLESAQGYCEAIGKAKVYNVNTNSQEYKETDFRKAFANFTTVKAPQRQQKQPHAELKEAQVENPVVIVENPVANPTLSIWQSFCAFIVTQYQQLKSFVNSLRNPRNRSNVRSRH